MHHFMMSPVEALTVLAQNMIPVVKAAHNMLFHSCRRGEYVEVYIRTIRMPLCGNIKANTQCNKHIVSKR